MPLGGTVHRKGGPDMAEINSPGGPLSAGDQIFRDIPQEWAGPKCAANLFQSAYQDGSLTFWSFLVGSLSFPSSTVLERLESSSPDAYSSSAKQDNHSFNGPRVSSVVGCQWRI